MSEVPLCRTTTPVPSPRGGRLFTYLFIYSNSFIYLFKFPTSHGLFDIGSLSSQTTPAALGGRPPPSRHFTEVTVLNPRRQTRNPKPGHPTKRVQNKRSFTLTLLHPNHQAFLHPNPQTLNPQPGSRRPRRRAGRRPGARLG